MTKDKEVRLLITSGDGPAECRRAVSYILIKMKQEAANASVTIDFAALDDAPRSDPSSVVVTLLGNTAEAMAQRWVGTIQWTCQSAFRPDHKRRNWFAGVFRLPPLSASQSTIQKGDLKFETFRAGGPGGQHQNSTDSAVRVVHLPTGVTAVSRDERSQHRNKQTAVDRLSDKLTLIGSDQAAKSHSDVAGLHRQLERGNPVRCFLGENFQERKGRR